MSVEGWIVVGLVGGLAALARFVLDSTISARAAGPFPTGILVVNLLGALLLGLVAGSTLDGEALTIVAGGTIGSFTTFSTWMLDTQQLKAAEQARLAYLNIAVPLLTGFLAVALGHWIAGA